MTKGVLQKKTCDVLALGEILIDFTPCGNNENRMPLYECNPGGAPANLLTCVSRMGGKTAMIGKVGSDYFGDFLRMTLQGNNVSCEGLRVDPKTHTTLAFVSLNEHGDRSFSFCRGPGADCNLIPGEVEEAMIAQSRLFHFGSISLTDEPARSATQFAIDLARQNGLIISFDPNYRASLWESPFAARGQIVKHLCDCDILKVSEEEFELLTGAQEFERDSALLMRKYGITLLLITLGPKGACYRFGEEFGRVPTYDVKVVDTTGAGDAFMGGILSKMARMEKKDILHLKKEDIESIVAFGNACGSLTAGARGGIPAIPTREAVEECIARASILMER